MRRNFLTLTDLYKPSHYPQYPAGTNYVYSYFESRGGMFSETVFFGLQYILKEYLEGVVFTQEDIDEAEELYSASVGPGIFNRQGWQLMLQKYGGRLPLRIKAVQEGTVVPGSNVLMTIENTDPVFPWLTNYVESLLMHLWNTVTIATASREIKKSIIRFLEETSTDYTNLLFMLNDFGFRGVSSVESAGVGGMAHLVSFLGSDNWHAIRMARHYYWADVAGFSVPASEHSTTTSWGKEGEADAYENMLDTYDKGIVSIVVDSYDTVNAVKNILGGTLRDKIKARNGKVVVRPDSGDPKTIVVQILDILGEKFGYELNTKGFKVLPPCVGVIQGDGVDIHSIPAILSAMKDAGWAANNVVFGSGGALLQKWNRDTLKFAIKCSYVVIGEKFREVYKEPKTDSGKSSKRGRLALVWNGRTYVTVKATSPIQKGAEDQLQTVFENGKVTYVTSFDSIRDRAEEGLNITPFVNSSAVVA